MQRGSSLTKKDAICGEIPVISGGKEPAFYCNIANRIEPCITIAGSGAGAGYVQYFEKPIFANDCFTIIGNENIDTKYLYYYLSKIQNKIYATKKGAGVPHVHISDIANFNIPIPPPQIQKRIVKVLDNFDAVCSDLNIGLPAEIEARQKQYEYYRDMLLTFADTGEIIAQTDRQTDRQTDMAINS